MDSRANHLGEILFVPPEVTRTLTAAGIPAFLQIAFLLAFLGYTWAGYALLTGKR